MPAENRSKLIAETLSALWDEAKRPEFAEYVRRFHHMDVGETPNFRCLFIGETEDGDVETGPKSALIKQWWIMDDQGLREVLIPKMDWGGDSAFFPTPLVLFYHDGDGVSLYERLGQKMACWKSGRLHLTEELATLNLKLLDDFTAAHFERDAESKSWWHFW